jgi:glycosyltransferase involved in cell wall biosynthesis
MTAVKPQVLLVHPGTQYAPHLARELSSHGMLHRFWTGFALAEDGWGARFLKLCPASISSRLGKRMMEIPRSKLRSLPLLDWRARRAARSVGEEAAFFERNRRFQKAVQDDEIGASNVVIGFDTSAWLLGRRAKAMQRKFILDQSIGHPAAKERIFESLRQRFPAWRNSAPKKANEIQAVEREEHDLADVIVAPSEFVKQTLSTEGVEPSKIHVIPFGTDLGLFHPPDQRDRGSHGKPVAFLFVGGLTVRKGLPVLLAAWRQMNLPAAELWLVGSGELPAEEKATLPQTVKILGPKGRVDVAALMRESDVFVFPSFFEGLAQVQIEAMATGLPVIGTHESGAGGLVQSGVDGEIVPAGDEKALADAMRKLATDHDLRRRMQASVLASREQLSWKIYGDRWAALLTTLGC